MFSSQKCPSQTVDHLALSLSFFLPFFFQLPFLVTSRGGVQTTRTRPSDKVDGSPKCITSCSGKATAREAAPFVCIPPPPPGLSNAYPRGRQAGTREKTGSVSRPRAPSPEGLADGARRVMHYRSALLTLCLWDGNTWRRPRPHRECDTAERLSCRPVGEAFLARQRRVGNIREKSQCATPPAAVAPPSRSEKVIQPTFLLTDLAPSLGGSERVAPMEHHQCLIKPKDKKVVLGGASIVGPSMGPARGPEPGDGLQ